MGIEPQAHISVPGIAICADQLHGITHRHSLVTSQLRQVPICGGFVKGVLYLGRSIAPLVPAGTMLFSVGGVFA